LKDRIVFRSWVLGAKASQRLRKVKGKFLVFRSSCPQSDIVDIYLDDDLLGEAKIISCQEVTWVNEIKKPNVHLMAGFDSPSELMDSLHRGRYRRELANKVIFMADWGTESFLNWRPQPTRPEAAPQPEIKVAVEPEPSTAPLPPDTDERLYRREERIAAREAKLEAEKSKLEEAWKKLDEERRDLEVTRDIKDFNEVKASRIAEQLRKDVAEILTSPGGKEFRMWQLRTASEIISYLAPYLRVDLAIAHRNWLKIQPKEEG
jgi:hypothetical protein